jgi:stage II sporulation protein R
MKLKKWEIALTAAVIATVLWGFHAERQQTALAEKLIRFHVVADSDCEGDQDIKLKVRDAVMEELNTILDGVTTREEAYTR